jgi:hypothetical protein
MTILRQKIIFFFQFLGARAGCAPLDPPLSTTPFIVLIRTDLKITLVGIYVTNIDLPPFTGYPV